MAAGSTYTPIATTTVGTATSSVVFSSIAGTYTDLVISYECFTTAGGARDVAVRFNSDTGSNYSSTFLSGNGTSAVSARESSQTRMMVDYSGVSTTVNTAGIGLLNIMNYSNTTTHKTVLSRCSAGAAGVDESVGLWGSTAAITSITFDIPSTQTFSTGSRFTLYGIKAA